MRRIVVIFLLGLSLPIFSQDDTSSARLPSLQNDTVVSKLAEAGDSARPTIEIRQKDDANIKAILELSKEIQQREAKQKRNAMIRIGIGLIFLTVLVVGLMRKRKK